MVNFGGILYVHHKDVCKTLTQLVIMSVAFRNIPMYVDIVILLQLIQKV